MPKPCCSTTSKRSASSARWHRVRRTSVPSAQPWAPRGSGDRRAARAGAGAIRFIGHIRALGGSLRPPPRASLRRAGDGERVWVQGELLVAGHARAYGLPGSYACMPEMLAHERVARQARRALWGNAAYAVRSARRTARADAPAQFLRDRCRHRRQGRGDQGAHLHQLRRRLARRLHRRHRRHACCAPIPNGPRRWPRSKASASRCAAGSSIATAPTSTSRIRARSRPVDETLPGLSPPPAGAMTSSDRDEQPAPEKEKRPAPKAPGALDL